MRERIMTERQVKEHQEKMRKMRGIKGGKRVKIYRDRHCTKSKYGKRIEPDKTQEFETRFRNIWHAIKDLESRIIQLESKEEKDEKKTC